MISRRRRRLARARRANQSRRQTVALPLTQLDTRWLIAFAILALLAILRLVS